MMTHDRRPRRAPIGELMARRARRSRGTFLVVQVAFLIFDPEKRISGWEATIGKRSRVRSHMGGARPDQLPHDLLQYVVEAEAGYKHGFWDLVSKGATFRSTDRRRTKPGRALIAQHRAEIKAAEGLPNAHVAAWRAGERTPVTSALDKAARQWTALAVGDRLVFRWPSTEGVIEHA
jgi:hypothetical protein